MSKKHKHAARPLAADHVVTLEDGSEFLVAVVQESDDLAQVTGTVPGGIGCVWVDKAQLRKATVADREAAKQRAADDQQDDAGDAAVGAEGDDQNAGGGTTDAQA